MACERYEILLVDAQGQAKQLRDWTERQLLDSVPWLKRMNARGHDVLVRPHGQTRPVLLDKRTHAKVTKLEHGGVPFLAKIELEADRFQVWLRLGNASISSKVGEAITESLGLRKFHADMFGSPAGFVTHQSTARGGAGQICARSRASETGPRNGRKVGAHACGYGDAFQKPREGKSHIRDRGISR